MSPMQESQDYYHQQRLEMVATQIKNRGIYNPAILKAMQEVPRHLFVSDQYREEAYNDYPLPIAAGQTISQPYIVALMLAMLNLDHEAKLLEIGSGCGYSAAVASRLVQYVYGVEIHEALVKFAKKTIEYLGYTNISFQCSDGNLGWKEHAPYNGILVAAAGKKIPRTLLEQLQLGGKLIIPIENASGMQSLILVTKKSEGEFLQENLGAVRFVPLIQK